MALHLHRAPRTDLLADALGDLLSTPLADPFATELVLVPARGVERWLSQRLSHRLGTSGSRGDGVCAGVEFRFPRSLVACSSGTSVCAGGACTAALSAMSGGVASTHPIVSTKPRHMTQMMFARDIRRSSSWLLKRSEPAQQQRECHRRGAQRLRRARGGMRQAAANNATPNPRAERAHCAALA